MTSTNEEPGGPDGRGIQGLLWELLHSILDDSAPALESMGLTSKAFFLLAAVQEHPFPAELARAMHLPPPTVTYLVKQLEAAGLVERRAEPGDLRKFRLVVTGAGLEAIADGSRAMGLAIDARISRIAPDDLATFVRVVERMARPES